MSTMMSVCLCVRLFSSVYFLLTLSVVFRCDSPEKLKSILPRLEQELKDTTKFKDFYQFTFNFAKNPTQKGLGKSSAGARGALCSTGGSSCVSAFSQTWRWL